MFALLVLLFVIVPVAELYVLVQVASDIGALNALALLFLVSIVGAWIVKREGLVVLRRMQETVEQRKVPHNEVVDGFLLLLAGGLLLVPGFITDAIGLVLLLPPVRIGVRALIVRSLKRRGAIAFNIISGTSRIVGFDGVYDVDSSESVAPPKGELPPTPPAPPRG